MSGLKFRLADALAPRELAFFSLLDAAGSNAAAATAIFNELAHFFPERHDLREEILLHARESDRIPREPSDRLSATFVTPIEREDLQAQASAIDDLVRTSHAVAALFDIYLDERVRAATRRLTQLLARKLPQPRSPRQWLNHPTRRRGWRGTGPDVRPRRLPPPPPRSLDDTHPRAQLPYGLSQTGDRGAQSALPGRPLQTASIRAVRSLLSRRLS